MEYVLGGHDVAEPAVEQVEALVGQAHQEVEGRLTARDQDQGGR